MKLIKRRAAASEPLVIPRRPAEKTHIDGSDSYSLQSASTTSLVPSTSGSDVMKVQEKQNMEKLKRFGQKGFSLLETSRQIATGEREVKLSFASPGVGTNGPVRLFISKGFSLVS